MPPNKKGGKNYKKGKHTEDVPILYERTPDQMYGRVVKLLGGCNALVYCNDNQERLCHIRGSMRKKVWIAVGDIVLISVRDLAKRGDANTDRGDICAKYDPRVIYNLREKDPTINLRLFDILEKTENVGHKGGNVPASDDFGFIFTSDNNMVIDEENSETETDKDAIATQVPVNRIAQRTQVEDDDDINIDDI
jgi:translation initiation factor 1A